MEAIPGQLSSVGVPVEGHSIDPVSQALLPWQLEGLFTLPQGLHARVNAIKGSY